MKYRDFLREAKLRTIGVDGWRLVGKGLLVPAAVKDEDEWRARFDRMPEPSTDDDSSSGPGELQQ